MPGPNDDRIPAPRRQGVQRLGKAQHTEGLGGGLEGGKTAIG